MRMEEIWQEKWETAQSRILQLETEAQKSNEMMKAMTAENQSLKSRIEQLEANEHIRQQELIKQCQKTANLESVIKNLSDRLEYYCTESNDELEEFHMNWKDLQEVMQNERNRTRRILYRD